MYNLKQLQSDFQKGKKLKYLFFWGHSQKGNEVTKACFSQWYPTKFIVEGITYASTEHYMMAEKARLFEPENDTLIHEIINASSPAKAKKLGRNVLNFKSEIWDEHKCEIVTKGNFHKFDQNPDLKEFLLNTGKRIIVEASPVDAIWGIGMDQNHQHAYNPVLWRGENLLGFCLMEVREQLNSN